MPFNTFTRRAVFLTVAGCSQAVVAGPLLLSQAPQDPAVIAPERLTRALERIDLLELVSADRSRWQTLDGVVAIPWKCSESA